MNPIVKAALLMITGAAVGVSSSALIREVPGVKSYYVHQLNLTQSPLLDGGNTLSASACTTATVARLDGGTLVVDLGCVPGALTPAEVACGTTLLNGTSRFARDAP